MKTTAWEKDAEDFFEKFLTCVTVILQPMWRKRLQEQCSCIAACRGAEKISREIVLQAIEDIIPHDLDPLVQMIEDPEGFKKEFSAMFEDPEAYNKVPIEIKRWDSPFHTSGVKPAVPPAEAVVIAFCASPRKGGNTDILIDRALEGAASVGAATKKYYINDLKIGYCIGCRKCKEKTLPYTCTVKDDMTPLYDEIRRAHCVVIGFPVYTSRESAQLAVFLDRWDCFEGPGMKGTLPGGKRAMVIGTWGYPKVDMYDHHMQRVIGTLKVHRIQTVEAVSASGFEGLLHGLDEQKRGVVLKNSEGLQEVFDAGRFLVTG